MVGYRRELYSNSIIKSNAICKNANYDGSLELSVVYYHPGNLGQASAYKRVAHVVLVEN